MILWDLVMEALFSCWCRQCKCAGNTPADIVFLSWWLAEDVSFPERFLPCRRSCCKAMPTESKNLILTRACLSESARTEQGSSVTLVAWVLPEIHDVRLQVYLFCHVFGNMNRKGRKETGQFQIKSGCWERQQYRMWLYNYSRSIHVLDLYDSHDISIRASHLEFRREEGQKQVRKKMTLQLRTCWITLPKQEPSRYAGN